MIAVSTLHNEVRFNINLLNSDFDESISSIDIDVALNRAKDYIIQNYSMLAERSKLFKEHLRELQISNYTCQLTDDSDKDSIIALLPKDYYTLSESKVIGLKNLDFDKKICEANIWNVIPKQSDDISLHDPNCSPSWEWRTVLYNMDSQGIRFYHNREFEIKKVIIKYIKNVPDVAYPTAAVEKRYIKADGTAVVDDSNLEISSTALWRKITEIASFFILKRMDKSYQGTLQETVFMDSLGGVDSAKI